MNIIQKNKLAVTLSVASIPMLAIYFIFLNEPTIFRDLFYFTIIYVITSINMLEVRKYKIDKADKFAMLISAIFWLICLILIYIMAFSDSFVEYLNKCSSNKWGLVGAFLVLFSLIAIRIKLYTNDRKRKRQNNHSIG